MGRSISQIALFILLLTSTYSVCQVTLSNTRYYNGNAGASDKYNAVVSDKNDYVYAAGSSTDDESAYIVLEKFTPSGTKLWSGIYRGIVNGYAMPVSIALDSSGGIYVAGFSKGQGTSYDFLLIKFNQSGDTVWSRNYNGTLNGDDRPVKVAVDGNGAIVIAGNAYEINGGREVVLIKYNPSGNLIWKRVYHGNSGNDDYIYDFAFDRYNFIYTASSYGISKYGYCFQVMKINTDGDTVWTRRQVSPQTSDARAIYADDSLNVYATGRRVSNSDTSTFYTVKYNASGDLKWAAVNFVNPLHRDAAYRIDHDETGNIYIAGELNSILLDNNKTMPGFGYCVIKYSPSGQKIWETGVENYGVSNPTCRLRVFSSSNIYLGYNFLDMSENRYKAKLIKLNQGGDTSWSRVINNAYIFNGMNDMCLDAGGNAVLASSAYGNYDIDAAILKYSTAGSLMWENYSNSSGFSNDNAIGIGRDYQNNIYVTGINSNEYVILKYNQSFTQQWASVFSDGYKRNEAMSFSTNDSNGNVYVTGLTSDSTGNKFIIVLKYNASGIKEWERKYTGNSAEPWSICTDRTGNVIIAGTDIINYNHFPMRLLKYSPSGTLVYNTSYTPASANQVWIYSVAADYDNNIIVAGCASGASLWKFSSSGAFIRGNYYNTVCFNKLAVDRKNNVYVCGYTQGSGTGYDFLTIKYDTSGVQKWVKIYNGTGNSDDYGTDIVLDSLGNAYVTGEAVNQTTNYNQSTVTIKYDSLGNTVWQNTRFASQNGDLVPVMIDRDRFNNIYVLCKSNYYQSYNSGYYLMKYRSNGDSVWTYSMNNSLFKNVAKAFLLMGDDRIYITGKAYGNNTGYDIVTLELTHTVGIERNDENVPLKFGLSQNYPNPFNQTTIFNLQCSTRERVVLKVYDITGREVQTILNEVVNPGVYRVRFDGEGLTSGIYFYSMRAGNYVETRKMVFLK